MPVHARAAIIAVAATAVAGAPAATIVVGAESMRSDPHDEERTGEHAGLGQTLIDAFAKSAGPALDCRPMSTVSSPEPGSVGSGAAPWRSREPAAWLACSSRRLQVASMAHAPPSMSPPACCRRSCDRRALVLDPDVPHAKGHDHLSGTKRPDAIARFDARMRANRDALAAPRQRYGLPPSS